MLDAAQSPDKQAALELEEILPTLGRIDTAQLASNLAESLASRVDAEVSRAANQIESSANRTLNGVTSGLNEAKESLTSTIEEHLQQVSIEMTRKVSHLTDVQKRAEQSTEMAFDEFQRKATALTTEIVRDLQKASGNLRRARSEAFEVTEQMKNASQATLAELRSAARLVNLKHWVGSLSVVILTMLIGLYTLYRVSPGWTLTEQQHAEMYMGQHVMDEYWRSDPDKQRQIEDILGLNGPAERDRDLSVSP